MSSTPEPTTAERTGARLRIGLLLGGFTVPAWVRMVVADLRKSAIAEPTLIVLDDGAPHSGQGLTARLWRNRHHLVYRLYARLDRRLLPVSPDPFERVAVDDLLTGVPVLRVSPHRTAWSDYFPDDALEEIRAYGLDVALRFGFRILRGGVLDIARHGVWSYHHGDNRVIRGGPPGYWEVMERQAVTGSILQVLGEGLDAGRVIYRSWSPTHRRSVHRNKAHVYWKSAAFVDRCLTALAETGNPASGVARREDALYRPYGHRLYRKPTNGRAAALLVSHAARAVASRLREAVAREQWFPAFRIDKSASDRPPELFRFTPVLPPRDRIWADPFPVRHGAGWVIFVEEKVGGDRGSVAALEVDPDGRWSTPRPVLERPHHLSHPFVFRWRGTDFLMPESGAARHVEVHRAVRFPGEWTLESIFLEDLRIVDPTLHEEDGTWWLFANVASEECAHAHDELHLFHASSPFGPWEPHRHNPVVSDARCARPAGRLLRWRGDLYRPAQDSSLTYGYAISLQRVRRLDRHEYKEETACRILPRWLPGLLATHTFNRCEGLTVVDGLRRV